MTSHERDDNAVVPASADDVAQTTTREEQEGKQPGAWRFLRMRSLWCVMFALCLIGACVGAAGLCALYHASQVTWPVYFFVTRPPFLWFTMLAPGLALGFFGVRKRWFLVCLVFWCVCLFASDDLVQVFKFFPGGVRESFDAERMAFTHFLNKGKLTGDVLQVPLRVVSWNVAAGTFDGKGVVLALDNQDADLIFMQEFYWGAETHILYRLKHTPRLQGMFKGLGMETVFSRYPLTQVSLLGHLPARRCNVIRVDIRPDTSFFIVNVHLSEHFLKTRILRGWTTDGLRQKTENTRKEFDGLQKIIEHYSAQGPVIVAGDFNLPAMYPDLQFLKATHVDCFAENGYGWGKTALNKFSGDRIPPQMRVDMIWAPRNAVVQYCAAVRADASDHDLVLAEITLPVPVQAGQSGEQQAEPVERD